MADENVRDYIQERAARGLGEPVRRRDDPPALAVGGGGPHDTGMFDERIGRLEGAVEGLRHSQNLTIGATVGVGAILAAVVVGFGIYTLQRVDALADKVNALPGQISAELRDITKTLAESITAAKQAPPQIIVLPAPNPSPPQPPQQPPKL